MMIRNKIKIGGSIVLLILFSAIFWGIGFFNGARKAFLLDSLTNATSCIYTIKYIDKQEYEKAKSFQATQLDGSMAGIDYNSMNNAGLLKIYRNMRCYYHLLSFNEKTDTERIKKCYSAFLEGKGK